MINIIASILSSLICIFLYYQSNPAGVYILATGYIGTSFAQHYTFLNLEKLSKELECIL